MGKRSSFERRERDYYPTPYTAVVPLLEHLREVSTFSEPCAGDGRLISHLTAGWMECVQASDLVPIGPGIEEKDVFDLTFEDLKDADVVITNPPWDRKLLHPMISHLAPMKPTWLLFDADWAHTKQASQFLPWCRKIVSVGRVKWIEGSQHTGKDNCAWYLFDPHAGSSRTYFYGRN